MRKLAMGVAFFSASVIGAGRWSEPVCLWSDTVYIGNQNIVLLPDGKILAAWSFADEKAGSSRIYLRINDGTEWSAQYDQTIPGIFFGAPFPWATDAEGASWTIGKNDSSVYALSYDGESWSAPEWVWNVANPSYAPGLIRDQTGQPYAVLNDWGGGFDVAFKVSWRMASGWVEPMDWIHTSWCMGGGDFQLGCDRKNRKWLVWGGLELGVFDGETKEVLIPYVHTCQPVGMTFDLQNNPWLFFQFEFDTLTFSAHRVGETWSAFDTLLFNCHGVNSCCDSTGRIWLASTHRADTVSSIVFRCFDPGSGGWSETVVYDPLVNWFESNPVLMAVPGRLWLFWNADSGRSSHRLYASYRDLAEEIPETVSGFREHQILISPNPLRRAAKISFSIPRDDDVRLAIHDAAGRRVTVLWLGRLKAGTHDFTWVPSKNSAGVHFCKLETGNLQVTKKIVVVE